MLHAPKLPTPDDLRRIPAMASRSLQQARATIGRPHLPQLKQQVPHYSPAPLLLDTRIDNSTPHSRDWSVSAHKRPADVLGSIHSDGTDYEVQFLGFSPEPYRFDSFDASLDYFSEFVSALDLGHTDRPTR